MNLTLYYHVKYCIQYHRYTMLKIQQLKTTCPLSGECFRDSRDKSNAFLVFEIICICVSILGYACGKM